ncbi:MAG TPA: TetR/AcrR family transcriptional regulator, partial [Ilumatobacteraceae bacterium]|nr:TetR/AcrR family transcriptional regulator [Ilumatobacteraceae bacterium]
ARARRGGAKARLDREAIVAAGLTLAAQPGVGSVSVRDLGAQLGADPTAIYRHFSSKEALVVAMAERLFAEVASADYPTDWRERFTVLMHASRDIYRAHPALVDVLANQREESPSLIAVNELSIGCLIEAGLDRTAAGLFHQVLTAYVVGTGVLDASWGALDDDSRDAARRTYSALDPRHFPNCVHVGLSMFPEADEVIDFATEIFLDAITRIVDAPASTRQSTNKRTTSRK